MDSTSPWQLPGSTSFYCQDNRRSSKVCKLRWRAHTQEDFPRIFLSIWMQNKACYNLQISRNPTTYFGCVPHLSWWDVFPDTWSCPCSCTVWVWSGYRVGALGQSHLLCGAFGKPLSRQSCLQLHNVDASIFVEVQLLKQLGPALLPLLLKAWRPAGLAVHQEELSPVVPHKLVSQPIS